MKQNINKFNLRKLFLFWGNFKGIILNFILCILSYIIKKEKGSFIIGARSGTSFSENSKYLYLYANKIKKNKKFIWFTKNKTLFKTLKEKGLPVVYALSFSGFWKILKAEKLIISSCPREVSYFRYLFGNFEIIQLYHGNAIKNINFLILNKKSIRIYLRNYLMKKQYSYYKFILHTSSKTKEIMANSFNNSKIEILGYPRNDFNYTPIYKYEDLSFIPLNKTILLYAPTFRDANTFKKPFSNQFLQKLDNLLGNKKSFLIIKNHGEKRIINKKKYQNIIDISEKVMDVSEILVKIDLLITDYSSICYDFSLLQRPIIFYPYDYDEYISKCRKIVINYFEDLPGPFALNEKDLYNLIKDFSWAHKKKYLKRYKKYVNSFNNFKDSKSCQRVYDKITTFSQ